MFVCRQHLEETDNRECLLQPSQQFPYVPLQSTVRRKNDSKKTSEITSRLKIVETLATYNNPNKDYMNARCIEVYIKP